MCGPGNTIFDTKLYAGAGCPISATAFGCLAANDDFAGCGYKSQLSIPTVNSRYINVVLTTGSSAGSGLYNLTWAYTFVPSPSNTRSRTPSRTASATNSLPEGWSISNTASPSFTRSASMVASSSGSPSGTSKATGTATGTPSPSDGFTQTPSSSATGTPTPTPTPTETATLSTGATPSETPTGLPPTPSESPSGVPTPSGTPSRTPSATTTATGTGTPLCGAMRVYDITGPSGAVTNPIDGSLAGAVVPPMSCPVPTIDSYGGGITGGPGYLVFRLDLGPSVRMGGVLTATTMSATLADTILFIGSGCPSSQASFGCINSGDDDPISGELMSTVPVNVSSPVLYMLVGGYGGAPVSSGISWSYVEPTPSRTPTASATATLSLGASPSPTTTGTRTLSPTRSNTGSGTPTNAPCSMANFRGALPANVDDGSVTGLVQGTTGMMTMAAADASTPSASTQTCSGTATTPVFNRNKHWWVLNLEALGLRSGGTLALDTCDPAGTMNTVLIVGSTGQCPSTAARVGSACWSNDNATIGAAGLPGCTSRFAGASGLVLTVGSLRALYIAVTLPNPTTFRVGSYNLRWTYTQPTPSNTPPSSITPSSTPSSSGTNTPSGSATISFGMTPSQTGSASGTGTPARTGTGTVTPSRTPSGTPSSTVSSGFCAPVIPVAATATGYNSTSLVVMAASGASLVSGATQPCAGGGFALQVTPHYAISVDLGEDFVPGGSLVATTTDTGTTLDTTLYVGTGCPSSLANFGCLSGNDDMASGVYQSRVSLAGWTLRKFTVVASAYTGNVGTMFVRVTYTLPSPTASGTGSPSGTPPVTPSIGATPSGTASPSGSSSETPTPTASVDYTLDPSETATPTGSNAPTPPATPSTSFGATGTSTGTPSGTPLPSVTGSQTATASPQCAALVPIARTVYGPAGSGLLTTVTNASSPLLLPLGGTSCGGVPFFLGPKAVFALDLGRSGPGVPYGAGGFAPGGLPLGYGLNISTCVDRTGVNSTTDTVVYAGVGCPTTPGNFRCLAANNDALQIIDEEVDFASGCSVAFLRSVPSWPVYLVVGGNNGAIGRITVSYEVIGLPSATPSATSSADPTPSQTASTTGSSSATPSLSVGASPSATPSASGTASASMSAGYSRSRTPGATPSGTGTRTPGQCDAAQFGDAFRGTLTPQADGVPVLLTGILNVSTGASLFDSASCATGPDTLGEAALKHVLAVRLPASAQFGGTLTVSACSPGGAPLPPTAADARIAIGQGCPLSAAQFRCVASGANTCGAGQGRAVVTGVSKRLFFVTVAGGGFGASGSYSLAVSYATPAPTPSITPSASESPSAGATPTETPSGTSSASLTATASPSLGYTASPTPSESSPPSPSQSASETASPSTTPSHTGTRSAGATPSHTETGTPTPSASETASVSSSGSETASLTASVSATPSETASVSATASRTGTATQTSTSSETGTRSSSPTGTPSSSATGTPSSSLTGTPSSSQTATPSSSLTGTPSSSMTGTPSSSESASVTASQTGTSTGTRTRSKSSAATPSRSRSGTATRTKTKTKTKTRTKSKTPTKRSMTPTPTRTKKRKLLRALEGVDAAGLGAAGEQQQELQV